MMTSHFVSYSFTYILRIIFIFVSKKYSLAALTLENTAAYVSVSTCAMDYLSSCQGCHTLGYLLCVCVCVYILINPLIN